MVNDLIWPPVTWFKSKPLSLVLAILWFLPSIAPLAGFVMGMAGAHQFSASLADGHVDLIFSHADSCPEPLAVETGEHFGPRDLDDCVACPECHEDDHVIHLPQPDDQRLTRYASPDKPDSSSEPETVLTKASAALVVVRLPAEPPPPDRATFWIGYLHVALPARAPSLTA